MQSTVFNTLAALAVFWSLGCSLASNCTEFEEISPDNYDRNYANINDVGRRPNGFLAQTLVYGSAQRPCFTVNGEVGQALEVKFETVPSMRLCFQDTGSGGETCSEGRFHNCFKLTAASQQFEFFCDVSSGCSESDVTFWLRITKGPPYEEDSEMMWCQWREEDYPGSLAQLPPGFTPPVEDGNEMGAASACALSITLAIACNVFLILCRRYMGHI